MKVLTSLQHLKFPVLQDQSLLFALNHAPQTYIHLAGLSKYPVMSADQQKNWELLLEAGCLAPCPGHDMDFFFPHLCSEMSK